MPGTSANTPLPSTPGLLRDQRPQPAGAQQAVQRPGAPGQAGVVPASVCARVHVAAAPTSATHLQQHGMHAQARALHPQMELHVKLHHNS